MICYAITSSMATALTGQEYTPGNPFTPFQDAYGDWHLHETQVVNSTNTDYIVYVPQDVENDIDAFYEFVGTPNVALERVHVIPCFNVGKTAQEAADLAALLVDQTWTTNCYFNPWQDSTSKWFLSDEEVAGLTNETFAWIRDLQKARLRP